MTGQDKDLASFPHFVLNNFLGKYDKHGKSNAQGDVEMRGSDEAVDLDLHKMALFRADELLGALGASQRLTVEEFKQAWAAMMPPVCSVGAHRVLAHGYHVPHSKMTSSLYALLSWPVRTFIVIYRLAEYQVKASCMYDVISPGAAHAFPRFRHALTQLIT